MTNLNDTTLPNLLAALISAKAEEKRLTEQRKRLEGAILALLPTQEEGTHTQAVGAAKLTATYKINRTVSQEVMREWDNLTEAAHKAFRFKPELDLKNYRALKELNPTAYIEASQFVTAKPATPSLSVEV